MKTFTTLTNLATNLSNNVSTDNRSLMGQLISDQHRYLIQKYFDNERTYFALTVGAENLTLTAPLSAGDMSATLSVAWPHASCRQLTLFSNSEQRTVRFTKGSTAITWRPGLTSAATTTELTTIGVQAYPIPATVSKITNDTITVGQLVYTPAPVRSIQEWTMINALPYTSDIPNYYYIYNGELLFWPIPSASGNLITFNHKSRTPDLSFEDYSTGTLAGIEVDANTITGVGTGWNSVGMYPLNTDLSFFNLFLKIEPPQGDGIWYPIQQFNSDTEVVLATPIQNVPSATASSYTIGQLPLLQEDFHDMLVDGSLQTYFSTIVKDKIAHDDAVLRYTNKLELLKNYAGTKSVNVNLGSQPMPNNPNLFLFAPPQ